LNIALDIGSVELKAAVQRDDGLLVGQVKKPIRGRLRPCLMSVLEEAKRLAAGDRCRVAAVTGGRSSRYAEVLRIPSISTIMAAYHGTLAVVPAAGAVLELGGEHSSFIAFGPAERGVQRGIERVEGNSSCSAGTGAFLEQEAHRFGLSVNELGRLAVESSREVRIAGRCAVFAKTDLVHKHQSGIPIGDLAYALCLGIARSITSELVGSEPFELPLAVIGGVASNPGMLRALRETLDCADEDLCVPEDPSIVSAIGALVAVCGAGSEGVAVDQALQRLAAAEAPTRTVTLPPLSSRIGRRSRKRAGRTRSLERPGSAELIGIDIGSTSTNIAWLGVDGALKEAKTVPTRGDPLAAAIDLLRGLEIDGENTVHRVVGVTGSGRRFVAEMIGADFAVNEITAHAAGCVHFFPEADTVFDIGGQDSKFIRLEEQSVVGFEMNKVCSAGTGSFLEEMSTLLGLNICEQFEREALGSRSPIELGERCTVFMGSEIARRLQDGCAREDLAAGLAYAVVRNYLTRVVGRHKVGDRVVFQGGVAANRAVVETLRSTLARDIIVHPFNAVAGAIGVALLAGRHVEAPSRFHGVESLDASAVRTKSFSCPKCDNHCTVHVTRGPSKQRFFAGGLCDRYEGRGRTDRPNSRLDLFEERDRIIGQWIGGADAGTDGAVGIPRAMMFHDQLPFWTAFLGELGIAYVLSGETTASTVETGRSVSRRGSCLPLAIAYGHVKALVDSGVRRILVPSIASLSDRTVPGRMNHACPSVQGWPYTTRALVDVDLEILAPPPRHERIPRRDDTARHGGAHDHRQSTAGGPARQIVYGR
jgi:predicted CoA-substrate-specific enzyme activase